MKLHPRPHLNSTFFMIAAILVLTAFLRLHDLNAQGLWGDEGWSIWLARGDSLRDLTMTMVVDHHGPVYSALLRGWYAVAGETVVALRAIAALFSVACVALVYRLGRELLNPAAGVGAALVLALLDKQTVLAQEVRDYPMVFFVMLTTALFYVRWRRDPRGGGAVGTFPPSPDPFPHAVRREGEQSPVSSFPTGEGRTPDGGENRSGSHRITGGSAFGFVASTVIGLYLHYYTFMVNLAILVHAALTLRPAERRHFLALNALIALAFLPWLPVVVHQFVNTPVDEVILTTHGMPLNRATIEYLAAESFNKPVAFFGLLAMLGVVGPLLARVPGPLADIPRPHRTSGALLAALWFGVPIIITAALHSRYPLLTDRNIAVIMPAIALLAGCGLAAFDRFSRSWIVALLLVHNLFTTSAFYVKPPWRAMAGDIAAAYPGGEPVLIDVGGEHAALWYHLLLALPDDVDPGIVNRLPDEAADAQVVSLYDLRKRYRDFYLPHLKAVLDRTNGLWIGYWGEEFKNNDTLDLLDQEGFVRTATLRYAHHGSPIFAFRYDRAASLHNVIARYGDLITLRRAALPAQVRRGEMAHIQLWWGTDAPPPLDYQVSVFLLDGSGVLRAQHDGPPAGGAAPGTTWTPGHFVFDGHSIPIPDHLPPGEYTVGVKLYTWWDGAILPAADGADYAVVGMLRVD